MKTSALVTLLLAGCAASRSAAPATPTALAADFELQPLGDGLWRHVSFKDLPGLPRFPSNGLVLLGPDGALLIDTPWTPEQTRLLLAWLDAKHAPVRDVIITHAHDDRMGGVAQLDPAARVHALPETRERAAKLGFDFSASELKPAETLQLAGERVEVFFPGAGHAPDNIVVFLPARGVLFGGCFVKAASARTLGNVADADLASWAAASRRALERYPAAKQVVPGHGDPGGPELLAHTRELVDAALGR